jgi:uncharacterized protein YqhQ
MLLLWEMLVLGTRLMTLSANVATGALYPDAGTPPYPQGASEDVPPAVAQSTAEAPQQESFQIGGAGFIFTLIVSLSIAVAVFFVGPLLLSSLLHNQIGEGWLSLTVEGLIRLGLLLGYLYLIGRVPDIERLFGYHGAEHKTINAMEQGDPLDIAHVRRASRVHTRCGTGFLLIVMVVSIFVFALVGSPSLLLKVLSRIILVPVVAGIAYELMRLGAANYRYRLVRWLLAPGLALQGLTTREPDDSMIECAIIALTCAMQYDQHENA